MRKQTELVCQNCNCNSAFLASRSDAIYCSNACRQNNYLKRMYGDYSNAPEKGKPTIYIMIWLNDLLFMIANGVITRISLDNLMQRISHQDEWLFDQLREHTPLRKKIVEICQFLSETLYNQKVTELNISEMREILLKMMSGLISEAKSAFTSEFPVNSNSKFAV